jgi:hypothetical protein
MTLPIISIGSTTVVSAIATAHIDITKRTKPADTEETTNKETQSYQ